MATIGLVVGDDASLTAGDTVLQDAINDVHTVTLVADEDAVPGGIDCFVIAESGTPTNLGTKYRDIAIPVITTEVGGWDDMRLTTGNGVTSAPSGQTVDLTGSHPIINGLSDPLTVYSASSGRFGHADTGVCAGATVFAVHPSTSTHWMGFAVDTGGALTTGNAAARRVALPYTENQAALLTTDGKTLLMQAIDWTLPDESRVPIYNSQYMGRF